MKAPRRNLSEWLRRLGVLRPGWMPDYAEGVFPVEIVGDSSWLVPQSIPPSAWAGGECPAVTNVAQAELLVLSPGGAIVRAARFGAAAALTWKMRIFPGPQVAGTVAVVANFQMGPTPVVSQVRIVTAGSVGFTTIGDPHFIHGANAMINLVGALPSGDLLYVPPGFSLAVEATVGAAARCSFCWTELQEIVAE